MARVPIVMRADGSVSAMKATDLKEVAERDRRIRQLEELNRVLSAEVDVQRQREHALSDAYLRLRRLIGQRAFDTPHGPTGEQVWEVTETALRELVAEVDRQRPVVEAAINKVGSLRQIHPDGLTTDEIQLVSAVTTYQASKPK